jgi:integrase/recombinase XerD
MTKELQEMGDEKLFELILSIDDNYSEDAAAFVSFLKSKGLGLSYEGLRAYADFLSREHDGKRYSAGTYNKRITGAKSRIRYLFEQTKESIDLTKRYQLEKALNEIKLKKINSHAVKRDRTLTPEEIDKLVGECDDKTIALMIEFLAHTGVRVSEMLDILVADLKRRMDHYDLRISGKGGKERTVFVDKGLVERIRSHFQGKKYLFEHSGSQYSRVSVSARIKNQGKVILSKDISAHTLRHSFATEKLKKTRNLQGVSKYLGHSSTATTADLYVHDELTWEDVQ